MKIILNQVLEDKGIPQNKMAKDTGISTATLRNLNHNRTTRISFDILEKICIYLDCGVEDILCVKKWRLSYFARYGRMLIVRLEQRRDSLVIAFLETERRYVKWIHSKFWLLCLWFLQHLHISTITIKNKLAISYGNRRQPV